MKKILVSLTMLAVFAPAVASAETNASVRAQAGVEVRMPKLGPVIKEINKVASTTRDRLAEIKVKIGEHREAAREHAEEARAKAREHFGDGVQKAVTHIVDRLTAAADRLADIATRIEAFIKTKQDAGFAMSGSVAALATASTDIATANAKIADAAVAINTALASTSPKGEMVRVRGAVKAAEDALKAAKRSLQDTLKTVHIEVAATSSAEVH